MRIMQNTYTKYEYSLLIFIAKIKYQSKIINFYDLNKPDNDYMIIESISQDKNKQKTFVYIIKFDKKSTIKIGRTNKVEILMGDGSVSRLHAAFHLINNKFYLEDFNSKFGTLVELQYDIIFLPFKSIGIYNEKCLLICNLKKTCFGILKCFNSKFFMWEDYNSLWKNVKLIQEEKEVNAVDLSPNKNNKTNQLQEDEDKKQDKDNITSTQREIISDNLTCIIKNNKIIKQESQINLFQESTLNDNSLIEKNKHEMIQKPIQLINKIQKYRNHSPLHLIKQTSVLKKETTDKVANQDQAYFHNNMITKSNDNYDNNKKMFDFEETNSHRYMMNNDDKNSILNLEEPENESIYLVNENTMLSNSKKNMKPNISEIENNQIDVSQIIDNCIEDDEKPRNASVMKTQKEIQFTLEKTKRK